MAVEAQHVYNLSWGKIIASRTTKSGMNLRKTLMVSGVLIKAKTAIVSQSFSEYRDPSDLASQTAVSPADEQPTSQDLVENCDACAENSPAKEKNSEMVPVPDVSLDNRDTSIDKENSESCSSTGSPESISDCCKSKGVLTQCNDVNKKRPLECCEQSEESPKKKRCVAEQEESQEPMDCANISSLVQRFDNGFTGLLAECETPSSIESTMSSGDTDCAVFPALTTVNYNQGLSEGFSSCSTQIKESFDALSPTPIFLTV